MESIRPHTPTTQSHPNRTAHPATATARLIALMLAALVLLGLALLARTASASEPGVPVSAGTDRVALSDHMTLRERLKARRDARSTPHPSQPEPISAPGDHTFTVHHEGLERPYLVHVPASYPRHPLRGAPLVMAFHGGGGNMSIMANDRYYGLITQSERSGAIVAFLNGYSRLRSGKLATWNAGLCCGKAQEKHIDDVGLVRAALADLQQRLRIDERRIFATGMSNGGMFSYRLACEMADTFKAVAAVAASDVTGPRCHPSQAISVLHIHARDDDHVLFSGGPGSASKVQTDFVSVPDTVAKWVAFNGCQVQPQTVLDVPGARCELHRACRGDAKVKLCTTETGGHSWPGGSKPMRRGPPSSTAISATEVIWDFFGLR